MKLIRIITGCFIALLVPLFGQNLLEGDMVENLDPLIVSASYPATINGKDVVIEKAAELLQLSENEHVVAMGTAVQGCGFVHVVNRNTGEDRYVDTASFALTNPDFDFNSILNQVDREAVPSVEVETENHLSVVEMFSVEPTDESLIALIESNEAEIRRLREEMERTLSEIENPQPYPVLYLLALE